MWELYPLVMYGCESWTVKKAQCWRIDAFELWCWRRLLRVPWTARIVLSVHWKDRCWSFSHLMWRVDSFGKDPIAGRDWGQEEKGTSEDEMVGWHNFEQAPGIGDRQQSLLCYSPWGCKESDMTEWLNRTDTNKLFNFVNLLSFLGLVPNRWEEIRWPPGTFKLLWSKINEENLA